MNHEVHLRDSSGVPIQVSYAPASMDGYQLSGGYIGPHTKYHSIENSRSGYDRHLRLLCASWDAGKYSTPEDWSENPPLVETGMLGLHTH
jgi:hypothetical protein